MAGDADAPAVDGRFGFEVVDNAAGAPGPRGNGPPGIAGERTVAGKGVDHAFAVLFFVVGRDAIAVENRQRVTAVNHQRRDGVGQTSELQQHDGGHRLGRRVRQVKLHREFEAARRAACRMKFPRAGGWRGRPSRRRPLRVF